MQNGRSYIREQNRQDTKVSIIVPAYNVQDYIEECMDSLIGQTLKEIEIIVINDGSIDETGTIINQYAKKDQRIIVINQRNQGLSAARNKGLSCAQGEYILFVDSDDYLEKNCVEVLYQRAAHRMDIVLYGASVLSDMPHNAVYLQEKRNKIWERTVRLNENICGMDMFCNMLEEGKFMSSVVIQLFRRNFLDKYNIWFSDGYIHEDFAFSFHSMVCAENVLCIADKLYNRRVREASTVTKGISGKSFKGRFKAYLDVLDIISDLNIEDDKIKHFYSYTDLLLHNACAAFDQCVPPERARICFEADIKAEKLYEAIFLNVEITDYIPDDEDRIWVFGAGVIGRKLVAALDEDKVIGIIDNHQKGKINKTKIYSFDEFAMEYRGELVVIASKYFTEMRKQLLESGIYNIKKFNTGGKG